MYSLTTLVVTGVFGLLGGAAIGALVLYTLRGKAIAHDLETRATLAENELSNYQRDVATHFSQTSDLINDLTQAYKNVHEHLAAGALQLATPAISRQIADSAENGSSSSPTSYLGTPNIEPPKDWAPRVPGTAGTLSEEYGLHEETTEQPAQAPTITESADDFDYDNKPPRY